MPTVTLKMGRPEPSLRETGLKLAFSTSWQAAKSPALAMPHAIHSQRIKPYQNWGNSKLVKLCQTHNCLKRLDLQNSYGLKHLETFRNPDLQFFFFFSNGFWSHPTGPQMLAAPRIVELRDHHGNTAHMYGQQALAASLGRGPGAWRKWCSSHMARWARNMFQ